MGSVPFAFSVHHFISSVGSDAGFASIIGLAILILLYFAHARETASLREQVYEWAQRVQQLEARVNQLSRQQASLPTATGSSPAAPAPGRTMPGDLRAAPAAASTAMAYPAPAAGSPVPAPVLAGAPAGVAAPALTAATKLIPTDVEQAPEPAVRTVPAPAGELPPDATAVVAPPPATVAGGANGSSHDNGPAAARGVSGAMAPGAPRGASGTIPPAPPRIQLRQGTPPPARRGTTPPRNQGQRPKHSGGRRGLALVLIALLAVAIVAGVIVLTSGGAKPKRVIAPAASSTTSPSRHRAPAKGARITPGSVTVVVLNGTAAPGLAGRISQKLAADGYKAGKFATAADQTRTSTEVAYLPGHQREAQAVARSLNLGPASVQAIDQSTQAVACSQSSGPCAATVVVTLGTDLAGTQ